MANRIVLNATIKAQSLEHLVQQIREMAEEVAAGCTASFGPIGTMFTVDYVSDKQVKLSMRSELHDTDLV